MRAPKALLLPFYSPGDYSERTALEQIQTTAKFFERAGIDVELAEPISSLRSAEAVSRSYNPYCYDFPILFPVTWSEPTLAVAAARQFFSRPIIVFSVGSFQKDGELLEMSSLPAAAALKGVLQEMGIPCEYLTCPTLPDDSLLLQIAMIANAARAISLFRTAKLGCFSFHFNGITSAGFDLSELRRRFGTEVFVFDNYELIAKMESLDASAPGLRKAREDLIARLCGAPPDKLDGMARMIAVLRDYVRQYDLSALNLRCHPDLSQRYGLTACIPLSLLGDELTCSCESDIPVTLTQLLLHALSGGKPATYADLRLIEKDALTVGACGMAAADCAPDGKIHPDGANGYFTNASPWKPGTLTMARLLKYPGGALRLQATRGTSVGEAVCLREMGCPRYPLAKIVPEMPMDKFVCDLGGNHYAFVYDDVLCSAKMFCKYMEITL